MIKVFRICLIGLCFFAATAHAADTLHGAVRFGIKADVEAMLAKGADVNVRDENGWTPLHALGEIVRGGHPSPGQIDAKGIAELLIAKGADINAKDKAGDTPLHAAARGGEKGVVELLLAKGANVNARNDSGQTALNVAGNAGVAKWLLAKGADVNAKGNDGETPLFRAIAQKDKDFVALLLAQGADINVENKTGQTLQRKALLFSANEISEMLKNHALKQKPNPRELFGKLIAQLKSKPNDDSTRQHIMKLAQEIKPAQAVPEEAQKFEGRAQYAFRNAKSGTEFLDAAREYLKAIEVAPWVAGYYYDLCVILEKANRPAEAARACKLYLVAAPQAGDAGNVRKLVAGLEYALERERGSVTNRGDCTNLSAGYEGGAKVARIGNQKISLKLYSVLSGGVWRNQLGIYDITTLPNNIVGQRFDLEPFDNTFRLDDRTQGTPWFRLTIARDGRITFGGHGSRQAEIMTSTTELHQLRNEQLKQCQLAVKDGNFFIALLQGGPLEANDRVNGGILFASDCRGGLQGDKPGWFPAVLAPHPQTPGITSADARMQDFSVAPANACQQTRKDNLGWLSQ